MWYGIHVHRHGKHDRTNADCSCYRPPKHSSQVVLVVAALTTWLVLSSSSTDFICVEGSPVVATSFQSFKSKNKNKNKNKIPSGLHRTRPLQNGSNISVLIHLQLRCISFVGSSAKYVMQHASHKLSALFTKRQCLGK